MEFVSKQVVSPLTANDTDEAEVLIPAGFQRWSLYITPTDIGGGADNPTVEIQYHVAGVFYPMNPAITGTAVIGQANIFTREDAINRIKVRLTNGATPPDQGVELTLYGAR